jgi:hypothetical protein
LEHVSLAQAALTSADTWNEQFVGLTTNLNKNPVASNRAVATHCLSLAAILFEQSRPQILEVVLGCG